MRMLVVVLIVSGCASNTEDVCESVGACAQGGDFAWIARCKQEAVALDHQAKAGGCSGAFDAYFACADDHYQCNGISAIFPGCDDARLALGACLDRSTAGNACADYEQRGSVCPGATSGITVCTVTGQCEARCFLDQVANVCAPELAELGAYTQCAQSCL